MEAVKQIIASKMLVPWTNAVACVKDFITGDSTEEFVVYAGFFGSLEMRMPFVWTTSKSKTAGL